MNRIDVCSATYGRHGPEEEACVWCIGSDELEACERRCIELATQDQLNAFDGGRRRECDVVCVAIVPLCAGERREDEVDGGRRYGCAV